MVYVLLPAVATPFFKNYSYVKRAGTVQSSLFLPKFPLHFFCKLPKVACFQNFLLT